LFLRYRHCRMQRQRRPGNFVRTEPVLQTLHRPIGKSDAENSLHESVCLAISLGPSVTLGCFIQDSAPRLENVTYCNERTAGLSTERTAGISIVPMVALP
jgi:hypothetical protein